MKITFFLNIYKSSMLQGLSGIWRGRIGFWENRKLKPPRKPRGGGSTHSNGVWGISPHQKYFLACFSWETSMNQRVHTQTMNIGKYFFSTVLIRRGGAPPGAAAFIISGGMGVRAPINNS